MNAPSSRRQLLLAGLALPLAAGTPAAAGESHGGDAAIVITALELERQAVIAYEQLLARGLVGPALGETLRDHERRHVAGLERALEGMGREPPAGPAGPGEVPGLAPALSAGRREAARFVLELERRLVAGYHAAQGNLENPRLLLPLASIMASEGQHLALLRGELGLDPIPSAFERGIER